MLQIDDDVVHRFIMPRTGMSAVGCLACASVRLRELSKLVLSDIGTLSELLVMEDDVIARLWLKDPQGLRCFEDLQDIRGVPRMCDDDAAGLFHALIARGALLPDPPPTHFYQTRYPHCYYSAASGRSATLIQAASLDRSWLIEPLLAAGAAVTSHPDNNMPDALFHAAQRGNAGTVGMLLRAGAPVDRLSEYRDPTFIDNVCPSRFQYKEYRTPLAVAGDPAVIEQLLDAGASINGVRAPILLHGEPLNENHSYFTPPIVAAILSGTIEVVRQLIAAGAVIDNFPTFVDHHRLPLVAAAERGFTDIVELLLDLGAPPNGHNAPGAPLRRAKLNGHDAVVALLLARGAAAQAGAD
ncbi:Ankyrin repeat domain-containing protein 50 [Tetrabaena socialis]|uniref:Ankyrin repeat domain-containing protein 50 n=1 Tax=Tetrabaena socialis TaxID=47790 RepID=A0A2J8A1S0_9CHLO|nr:Ankyrin repeat domain-containing protein 50 [Tetrabaena socialis]|eukprot:PNH06454.1 Ankyrin repeat domain-containing protein 50 [Tetrabaena socialis]